MGAIIPAFSGSGNTIYAQITDALTGFDLNSNTQLLEAYNQANWSFYFFSMPEDPGSSRYLLTVPGYLPNGRYFASIYLQAAGSPAVGDTPIDFVFFDWINGNAIGPSSPVDVGSINGSVSAAVNLSKSANAFAVGAATAGTLTTTQMTTDLSATEANVYAGRTMYFTSGVHVGRAVLVTAYAVTGGLLTFIAFGNLPLGTAPSIGDTFLII